MESSKEGEMQSSNTSEAAEDAKRGKRKKKKRPLPSFSIKKEREERMTPIGKKERDRGFGRKYCGEGKKKKKERLHLGPAEREGALRFVSKKEGGAAGNYFWNKRGGGEKLSGQCSSLATGKKKKEAAC